MCRITNPTSSEALANALAKAGHRMRLINTEAMLKKGQAFYLAAEVHADGLVVVGKLKKGDNATRAEEVLSWLDMGFSTHATQRIDLHIDIVLMQLGLHNLVDVGK